MPFSKKYRRKMVRRIRELIAEGSNTNAEIAEKLNSEGFVGHSDSKPVTANTVHGLRSRHSLTFKQKRQKERVIEREEPSTEQLSLILPTQAVETSYVDIKALVRRTVDRAIELSLSRVTPEPDEVISLIRDLRIIEGHILGGR